MNKKVLILGLGVNQGGVSSARFFAKLGAVVKVTDLKTEEILKDSIDHLKDFPEITYTLGEHRYEDIDWADLIIRNPGVKPNNEFLLYAKEKGKRVEMDLGIFFEFVNPSQVIGVTGTKGKSTTSTLLFEMLQTKYSDVVFGGNIGKGMLDYVEDIKKDSIVLLELSSFHLQACEEKHISPKYAVITNIYPDHLNYHSSMEEYVQMKRAILAYQNSDGVYFLRKGDPVTDTEDFKKELQGKLVYFSLDDLPKDFNPLLPGEHNKENIAAALTVAKEFGVDENESLEIAKNFKGVDFRLQLIFDKNGIKIYNDTTATNPSAATASLRALPNSILIAGGMDKNMNFDEFAKEIDKNAKSVYFLVGDATNIIKSKIDSSKISGEYDDLETLLKDLKENIKPGDTVLFSPGATSFNLFQNEFDRGRKFNEMIKKVFG